MTSKYKIKFSDQENLQQPVREPTEDEAANIRNRIAMNKEEEEKRKEETRRALNDAAEIRRQEEKKKEATRRALNDVRVPVERLSPLALTEEQKKQLLNAQKTPSKEEQEERMRALWTGGNVGEDDDDDQDSGDDHEDSDFDPEYIPAGERGESGLEEDDEEDSGPRFIPLKFDASKADGNAQTAARREARRGVRQAKKIKLREAAGVTFKQRRERAVENLRKLQNEKKLKAKERKRPVRKYTLEVLDKAVELYGEERNKGLRGPGGQPVKGSGVRAIAKRLGLPKSTVHDHYDPKKKKRRKIMGEFENFIFLVRFLMLDCSNCDFSSFSFEYIKYTY